jgi:hypothetical protein
MSPQLFAQLLNGREYGHEITKDEEATAKAAGLVVVFGASDDYVILRGAINDKLGAWDGTKFRVHKAGLLPKWQTLFDCEEDETVYEDYFKRKAEGFKEVEAVWSPNGDDGPSWAYKTDIPHAQFSVMEGEDTYCIGIVFALKDVAPA